MANTLVLFLSRVFVSRQVSCVMLFISLVHTQDLVVFQPSRLTATGPEVRALLLGHTSGTLLSLRPGIPSNTTAWVTVESVCSAVLQLYADPSTPDRVVSSANSRDGGLEGLIGAPSCSNGVTQWMLTTQQAGKNAIWVHLTLRRNLRLCGKNETDADCCPKRLCVLETLQVSACVGGTPRASLLIQANIHALLLPANAGSDNKTIIPNQVYQPLGSCPCDLTFKACDVRCCCDKDCSIEEVKLFVSQCLPGPFGGQVSAAPGYQCSEQSSANSPDWFPFLCVNSPPENNPYLGLFYQGDTIPSKPGPSFQSPVLSAPLPVRAYIQGSPILLLNDQYFTIPQKVLGQCVNNAPVAFLENFQVNCVNILRSCPAGLPLQTQPTDLSIILNDGQGGDVAVDVIDEVAVDMSLFISNTVTNLDDGLVCENVTVALDYTFYWKGNGITSVALTRTVGTITLNTSVAITTRYSAVFLNGGLMSEPNSGNPGYQVGRPVIAGTLDTLDDNNNTGSVQRTSLNVWKPVSDGLCSTAEMKPVLFGENFTSGCLLPVSRQNLTQCDLLREAVTSLQAALITATYVAKSGNPDPLTMTDWVNVSFVTLNSSTPTNDTTSSCSGVPSHQHIHVLSLITGMVEGRPQRDIHAVLVSFALSSWALDCGGGDVSLCMDPLETKLFPITSSVTFTDIPINTGPPKTRFQVNFTDYDCNRNDVCWPELAFPMTKYYTGEPYSQSLAKGLILVFFFIAASILGTPWRQIRQAWT